MRRSLIVLFLLAALPQAARAQAAAPSAADTAAVMAVVQRVFDAMRARDTTMLRSAFAPGARMVTPFVRQGQPEVRAEEVDGFVEAVGRPSEQQWDERIYHPEVRIDGGLATVWVQYDFFLGERFSHCGVDAFQLARHADGWKIVALADTRQQQGCPARG